MAIGDILGGIFAAVDTAVVRTKVKSYDVQDKVTDTFKNFSKSRTHYIANDFICLEELSEATTKSTVNFLLNERKIKYVQYFKTENGYLVQAKDSIFSKLIGTDQAIQFQLIIGKNTITVEISKGEWRKTDLRKSAVMLVKSFVFLPLAIPDWVGSVKQLTLLKEVNKHIERYIFLAMREWKKSQGIEVVDVDTTNTTFEFEVESAYQSTLGVTCVKGDVVEGWMNVGNEAYVIKSTGDEVKVIVTDMSHYSASKQSVRKGDEGILLCLSGIHYSDINIGDIICIPADTDVNAVKPHFGAEVQMNQSDKTIEGSKPLRDGEKYTFSFGGEKIEGVISLSDSPTLSMGSNGFISVRLSNPAKANVNADADFLIYDGKRSKGRGQITWLNELALEPQSDKTYFRSNLTFVLEISEVKIVTGLGAVVKGTIGWGTVNLNDNVYLAAEKPIKAIVSRINDTWESATVGDKVELLLKDVLKSDFEGAYFICKAVDLHSIHPEKVAEVYSETNEEAMELFFSGDYPVAYKIIEESVTVDKSCPKCGAKMGAKQSSCFLCDGNDATATNTNSTSVADEILKFKSLLDMGVLTQEEFNQKKKQLLNL